MAQKLEQNGVFTEIFKITAAVKVNHILLHVFPSSYAYYNNRHFL